MGLETEHIHRPGNLKQQNKPHKHWHRSKGSLEKLNKGRALLLKGPLKRHKQELKREEKRNQAQQARQRKRFEYLQKRRGFCEAPFLVGLFPLHEEIDLEEVITLLKTADPESVVNYTCEGLIHVKSSRIKQKFTLVTVRGDNLFDHLDVAKVCTTILFLASVKGISPDLIHVIEGVIAQGLPTSLVAVTDLPTLPQKKWNEAKGTIQKEIETYLPKAEKVMHLNRDIDAMNILRKIATQKQRTILQRDRRPHLLAESIHFIESEQDKGTLSLTGYLRGRNLSANSLVHIPGWGEFQIKQIDSAPLPGDEITEAKVLDLPNPEKQESLVGENTPDPMDAEQTWPTEEEMEECSTVKKVKKIPKGMSEYQAAWIPDEDAIELEDVEEDDEDDDAMELASALSEAESSESEEYETVTMASEAAPDPEKYDKEMDLNEESATLEKLRSRAKEDMEFPDEVDTPQDTPARERFARYRGLASFRTTPWDPKENLPQDYARIFQFQNFDRTKAAVLAEESSGVQVGTYVTVHLKDVPTVLFRMRGDQPLVIYGMLPHEQKMSVLNMVLKRIPGSDEPIASKENLLFQVGYRRFRASPIFSQHTTGNKHKYERFFQPESVIVATVFAPVIFPPASVLAFKENKDRTITPVAHGSVLSVNPNRIIVKRVVLSGHPFKVLKRSAIIRYMFFNREDIEWFKPVELRTKYGRRGHIKEPLGTHGHMKCVFNAQLKSQDTVLMHLYKRVFPKWTYDSCVTFAPLL